MDPSLETTGTSLVLQRVFKASPKQLWDLWTDPVKISLWHKPDIAMTTTSEVNLKVGGAFRISMTGPDGNHTAYGKFIELNEPSKLVYSWQWEGDPTGELSEVTLTFDPVPGGTKLTLVHDRLSGPKSVKAHSEGWLGCMGNINELIK